MDNGIVILAIVGMVCLVAMTAIVGRQFFRVSGAWNKRGVRGSMTTESAPTRGTKRRTNRS